MSHGLGLGAGSAAGAAIIIGVGSLALVNLRGQFALRA